MDERWRGVLYIPDDLLPLIEAWSTRPAIGEYLRHATALEAQTALSYLIWPRDVSRSGVCSATG